jgi:hypothetical protein
MLIRADCLIHVLSIFMKIKAINIMGIIFHNGRLFVEDVTHEKIHSYQWFEFIPIGLALYVGTRSIPIALFGLFGFPILYVMNVLLNLCLYDTFQDAYRNTVFEREAYRNQSNKEYLNKRVIFSWVNYI